MLCRLLLLSFLAMNVQPGLADEKPRTPREALQAFNDVIGKWRGTGTPAGSREEQQKGFWIETMNWQWQFKGDDAWIKIDIDKGKHFAAATLRFVPEKDHFALTVRTPTKETRTFTGKFNDKVLTLERATDRQTERLVFTFLHSNRFLYRQEVRPTDRNLFTRLYQVGATREGVPFAGGDSKPECIVSGGLGTIAVMHKGQTYHVCCSGCRDEFQENADKYVREYEEKKKKAK